MRKMPHSLAVLLLLLSLTSPGASGDAAAAAAAAATSNYSTTVMLTRCASLAGLAAPPPPAANASITPAGGAVVPWSGLAFLNLSFSFADPGTWQVNLATDFAPGALDVPLPVALLLSVYKPAAAGYDQAVVNVEDAGYRNFGAWPQLADGWTNLTILLASLGNVSLPLRSVSFGPNRIDNRTGWLGFADLAIVSAAAPGDVPQAIIVTALDVAPATHGVLVAGGNEGPALVGVVVANRLARPCAATVEVALLNSTGVMGMPDGANDGPGWGSVTCGSTAGAPLQAFESRVLACELDDSSMPAGAYVWRAVFTEADCWTASDGPSMVEGGVVIAPPLPPVTPETRNVRAGVFGGEMELNGASAMRIGMRSVRSGPLWRWAQWDGCWEASCFSWGLYDDGLFDLSRAGVEVMLDAREMCPPWAAAKNDSGPTWSTIPGPERYADYVRWLTVMLDRYGQIATSIEVSNEDDGLAYFMPQPLDYAYMMNLSVALINMTAEAMAASPAAAGAQLVGLSSSLFDVKQEGNGGTSWMQYERAMLAAPGVVQQLSAVTAHPYAQQVWVPWTNPGWGNMSFYYFNETLSGSNSSAACLMALAAEMRAAAAAQGLTNYTPRLMPSEFGYNLLMTNSATSGWPWIHAALVAQGLVHLRSFPLASIVSKAYYFAAYDGCCAESNGYFGLWRPQQLRAGADVASAPFAPSQPNATTDRAHPLPGAAAFATAAALIDVESGRKPGAFIVDNSAMGRFPSPTTQLPPSCVAFAPAEGSGAAPLIALFILGRSFNDRTAASMLVATTAPPSALRVVNGVGTPLGVNVSSAAAGSVSVALQIAALPQYWTLPADADPIAACASLTWD